MNTVSRKLLAHLSTLEDATVTLRVLLFVGTSSGKLNYFDDAVEAYSCIDKSNNCSTFRPTAFCQLLIPVSS